MPKLGSAEEASVRAAVTVLSASTAQVPLRPAGSRARSEMVALWFVSMSVCRSLRSWSAPFHLAAWLGGVAGSHREAEVGVQAHPLTWPCFLED